MGMVTFVQQQQQQQPSNENYQYHQKQEQDHTNSAVTSVEAYAVDKFHDEIAHEAVKESRTIVVPGNGSVEGSSTQCSDVDDDDENEEETEIEEGDGWITNLPTGSSATVVQQTVATTNGDVVLPSVDPTNFGDVCIKNSTNIHLGDKTFYKGPVTIKQIIYTTPAVQDTQVKLEAGHGAVSSVSNVLSTNKSDETANGSILPQNTELNKVTQWLCSWKCAAFLGTLLLIFLITVVVSSIYFTHNTDVRPTPVFPEIPDSSINVTTSSVRFVERHEWGAQPPSEPLTKLRLPVPYVIISHTVTDFCTTQSACTLHVRIVQTFHIESKNWQDIGYNFLVGGDGLAYVGRSWNYVGAHSFGFNDKSIGISFIGTFNTVIPPKAQLHAAQKIIELGVKNGKIAHNYKLLGHRQVSKTLSPGDALFSIIQKWPHWSPTP